MMRKCLCFLFSIILLVCLSVGASAESSLTIDSIKNMSLSDFPFNTSSPWCVRFTRWASSALFDIPQSCLSPSDSCSRSIEWYSNMGVPLTSSPSVGCWAYFDWEKDGIADHVGLVTWTDNFNVTTLEGNVNNAVIERHFTVDDPYCFGFNDPSSLSSKDFGVFSSFKIRSPSSSVTVVSPVDPSETSGFKAVLLGLIGPYDTIVTEHRYTSSSGYTNVSVDIQPDYVWWASAAIIALVILCLFRLIGGLIRRG